jgi:hypothetical protein
MHDQWAWWPTVCVVVCIGAAHHMEPTVGTQKQEGPHQCMQPLLIYNHEPCGHACNGTTRATLRSVARDASYTTSASPCMGQGRPILRAHGRASKHSFVGVRLQVTVRVDVTGSSIEPRQQLIITWPRTHPTTTACMLHASRHAAAGHTVFRRRIHRRPRCC